MWLGAVPWACPFAPSGPQFSCVAMVRVSVAWGPSEVTAVLSDRGRPWPPLGIQGRMQKVVIHPDRGRPSLVGPG